MSYKSHVLLVISAILMSTNSVSMPANKTKDACQVLNTSEQLKKIQPYPSQVIIVKSLGGIKANMTLCQRQGVIWKPMFTPAFSAVVGKNGIAGIGKKKEFNHIQVFPPTCHHCQIKRCFSESEQGHVSG